MSKLFINFLLGVLFYGIPPLYSASIQSRIAANLGNIYLNGLPKLAFDLGTVSELAELGFVLRMEHHARLIHGRGVRTRWDIPALRTCIYSNKEGDLIWVKPGGATERFRKHARGFAKRRDRLQIRESGDDVVEIKSPQGLTWKYKRGALESVSGRKLGLFYFTTDRESILKISRAFERAAPEALLQVIYSEQGEIKELLLRDNQYCKLQWTPDHLLRGLEDSQGNQTLLTYDNGLLAGWRTNDDYANNLKWTTRENAGWLAAQGWPPVALLEDSQYKYRLSRTGGINILLIYTHDNMFVSETRFNSKGIEQRTPAGIIKSTRDGLQGDAPAGGDP
jgi:hypothetical protein